MGDLRRAFLVLAVGNLLAGCVLLDIAPSTNITDAQFVSVERDPEAADRDLRVHFTTATDLAALHRQHNRSLNIYFVPCSHLKWKEGIAGVHVGNASVFDHFGDISWWDEKAHSARLAGGGSRGEYFFAIDIRIEPLKNDLAHYFHYDLASNPEDMCARIYGAGKRYIPLIGPERPYFFSTNYVVIPADAIRKALAVDTKN